MATADYSPLDLSSVCNAGADCLAGEDRLPSGRQMFHGIPFQVGPSCGAACDCLVRLDGDTPTVSIDVGDVTARHVLFAHRLLATHLYEGGPLGAVVAHYVIHYADGGMVRLPIRERFEIATVPMRWGQLPFLAVPDRPDSLPSRYSGSWGDAGTRLTEVVPGHSHAYYLWAWTNPQPERPVRRVDVEPAGPDFLLAGVTLGHLEEEPFCRTGATTVTITLPQADDAAQPFALDVQVDRGIAGFPYALPAESAVGFLGAAMPGYGGPVNAGSSPAYVRVAATPSATLRVTLGDEELGSLRWGDLEHAGSLTPSSRLHVEMSDTGRNWVRTEVLDDATGAPIPCRIHFRSVDGVPYPPYGHHAHLNGGMDTWHVDVGGDVRLGQVTYAYIDGRCEGWLPRGEVLVDVARGFEYEPLRTSMRIEPGQQRLTLRLRRWRDMNARGYYSGDTHVHFLSSIGAQTEARGEDLNVVNLLQSQWGHLFTSTEEFTGQPQRSVDGRTIVYVAQENRQHMLGHLSLLGLKQPVMPWCSDGPEEAELGGTLEATLSHWADLCHRQGGTVVIPHAPEPNGEPAALIATGRADAMEMTMYGRYEHQEYYRYLNGGYRLPLVGGTDKMSAEVPVGLYRTYVRIPDEEFSYESWCRNLRAGRTFHSGGPLIDFTVDGHQVGDVITLPGNGGTVEVEARADSILPIHRLEIVQQGRVVAAAEDACGARRLQLRTRLTVTSHTWLAARVGGLAYSGAVHHHDVWQRGVMAHTSPIYIAVGGEWWLHDAQVAAYMLTLLEGSVAYIRARSRQDHAHRITHAHNEADHQAFLERPFQEAIAAIHARLHRNGIAH